MNSLFAWEAGVEVLVGKNGGDGKGGGGEGELSNGDVEGGGGGGVGRDGAGEKEGEDVSSARISVREETESQGGAAMLARPCFLRRSASQRGRVAGNGGRRGGVAPCSWCETRWWKGGVLVGLAGGRVVCRFW